jgi:hypothetical protein
MPSISTMTYPIPAYVRVEVNWADVPSATEVAVYRVDCATGDRTPLRPYVSFDGDYLTLSCGYGIFWDTEAPLDTCFYYCTQAKNAAGTVVTTAATPLIQDSFNNRTLVDSWGSVEAGVYAGTTYILEGGTNNPGDYDVTAGKGTQTHVAVNSLHRSRVDVATTNVGILASVGTPVVATGANITAFLGARFLDANNLYRPFLQWRTDGTVSVTIARVTGGSVTSLGTANLGAYVAGDQFTIRFELIGNMAWMRGWRTTDPEPTAWSVMVTDPTPNLTGTSVAFQTRLEVGNTNTLPVILTWDDLLVYDPCNTLMTVERCSDNLTVASSHEFRLGDPVRPCNDVILRFLDDPDPNCVPTQGIFFGNMSPEVASAASGAFWPTNASNPIVINRSRQSLSATLTVATRTFMDRDALRTLNAPGSVTFLRGPAAYGLPDRYMSIGDVTETRPMSDHKIQPRMVELPHLVTSRPSGPSQGVCGARVKDMCDIYATLDALAASGLTWVDLLRGKASNDTPMPDTVERTFNDVNATYADWNAVNAGNADWADVLDGP